MGTIGALLVGSAGGMLLGVFGRAWVRNRRIRTRSLPVDAHHALDLLRRVHRAAATCVVTQSGDPVWSKVEPSPPSHALEEAVEAARLAQSNSREHTLQQPRGIVALGDGRLGIAVLFATGDVEERVVSSTLEDLRRMLADFQLARRRENRVLEAPTGNPDWLTPDTVEGIGSELLEALSELTARPAALVMRDPTANQATVVGVSTGADRRLLGMVVNTESVVGRATIGDLAAAGGGNDLFGTSRQSRREREDEGIAFSLRDGTRSVGALVVFCSIDMLTAETSAQVKELVADAGPLLARAVAVYAERLRVTTDELTGQPNKHGLEGALRDYVGGACSLVSVQIDDFGNLDPPAANAALQHVARIFRRVLRDYDVPARVASSEFALFLPDTPSARARDVAERIRSALSESTLAWAGEKQEITCSFGVASVPESAASTEALPEAAGTTLSSAKSRGANQLLVAEPLSS